MASGAEACGAVGELVFDEDLQFGFELWYLAGDVEEYGHGKDADGHGFFGVGEEGKAAVCDETPEVFGQDDVLEYAEDVALDRVTVTGCKAVGHAVKIGEEKPGAALSGPAHDPGGVLDDAVGGIKEAIHEGGKKGWVLTGLQCQTLLVGFADGPG